MGCVRGSSKGKEKEKETGKDKGKEQENDLAKDKEEAKEKDEGKATISEKQPSMTDIGNLPRKKRKSSRPTYQAVLNEDDFTTIADKVYDSMTEPITTFTSTQEALKQSIEAQLTELKTLVHHAPQVATPSIVHSAVINPEGTRHWFISVTPISICGPST